MYVMRMLRPGTRQPRKKAENQVQERGRLQAVKKMKIRSEVRNKESSKASKAACLGEKQVKTKNRVNSLKSI